MGMNQRATTWQIYLLAQVAYIYIQDIAITKKVWTPYIF